MRKKVRTFSGTTVKSESEREQKNRRIARRAAEEGIVVLKNEGVLKYSLTLSLSSLRLNSILLGKLGIAFLADLDLVPVDLLLVKALDGSPVADRACCPSVVELIADSGSSMCFGHLLLLWITYLRRL